MAAEYVENLTVHLIYLVSRPPPYPPESETTDLRDFAAEKYCLKREDFLDRFRSGIVRKRWFQSPVRLLNPKIFACGGLFFLVRFSERSEMIPMQKSRLSFCLGTSFCLMSRAPSITLFTMQWRPLDTALEDPR